MTIMSLTTISVTLTDRVLVAAAIAKLRQIDGSNSRQTLLTLKDEWAIARFGPSAALRNAAAQFIMDHITVDRENKTKVWERLYRFLLTEQSVVDRDISVFEQFIANSPDNDAVGWARSALGRLRARLAAGWKPPFTMKVIASAPKKAKVPPITVEAVVAEVAAPKKAKVPSKAKVKPVAVKATMPRRFVKLGDLQREQPGA